MVALETALLAERRGDSAEREWQHAIAALENQSKGRVQIFLGRCDGLLTARFGIDEQDLFLWCATFEHPIIVDRATMRLTGIVSWLNAAPVRLYRDSKLLVSQKQDGVQVFDFEGNLLGAFPIATRGSSGGARELDLSEEARSRLAWIPRATSGHFLDLAAGRIYDPLQQSGLAPLFRGSPVSSISVSPSGRHWVLSKEPAPGEVDPTESANRSVVQLWDAVSKKKSGEYPHRASDGVAVTEADVVLYDAERKESMLWSARTGKALPLAEDGEHRYQADAILSDNRSFAVNKFSRSLRPTERRSKTVWTYGLGMRPVEWQDASVLDVTSGSDRAILVRSSSDPRSTTSAVHPAGYVLEVVSLESGKTEAARSTTDSELRQLSLSPRHTKMALRATTGTIVLSLLDGRSTRLPYGERDWTMAWNGESEIAFARCGLETLDLVAIDGSRQTRRIPMRKDRSPGGCRPILFGDSGRSVAATIGAKVVQLEVETGLVEEASCGENCQLLAVSRTSDSVLLGWKRPEEGKFGVGLFGMAQRRFLAEGTVNLGSSSRGTQQTVAQHIVHSPDGRWLAVFSTSWIGIWDFNGTGAQSLRSIVPEEPEPLRPLAATDQAFYAISTNQTVLGWKWETADRVQISDEQARQLRDRLVLQMSAKNGSPIVLRRGSTEILAKILFDTDGLPTIVEDADGHIAFLGEGPRQKPYCIFGEVIAPFRACADLVLDEAITNRVLSNLAKGEYAEFQFR